MNHILMVFNACILIGYVCIVEASLFAADSIRRPNVLFIAMDDLNDWIGVLGGHPQSLTPNLDRLARDSVLFENAHCSAPACNPSRTAIFTGRSPHRTGVYSNLQGMRDVLPDATLIPKVFSRHSYHSAGSGKLLHYFIDAPSWDEYFPAASTENPFPRTLQPKSRPVSLPRGGPWQYVETDWGPLDATDAEAGGDFLVAKWVSEQLRKPHTEKPFFLACGIYRPHEPWFVPKKYFQPFPLNSIQLPPGYRVDDLTDVPPTGQRHARNRYFEHILKHKQWRNAIQGYLASIHYADAMLGTVLDTLHASPHASNTIVVLWSDHGWHLGEKEHWQKYTAWRACTRVPLMIRVPNGVPGLPKGTTPARCQQPVNLLSLAPTLLELCGLPAERVHDGPSLVPLLENPKADWSHVSITYLHERGSYGLSAKRYRLIHYANGDEELYDIESDPYEWKNLGNDPRYDSQRNRLRQLAPTNFAVAPKPTIDALQKLAWHPLKPGKLAPVSRPDGNRFDVVFINRSERTVSLWWMNRAGEPKPYGKIEVGKQLRQKTRPGAVWMIRDDNGKNLGYYRVGDRTAKAIIP
ncbi:sulfatase-like hydrolase/transferase [Thalassoroseus pseudoceratinae]|uniref:sulfatase-like hydrolase/transferase n=1 Tax=Thalassoroseus pseudoceratinae TaxID=2713176 RepID=UPI00197EF005|nr:sulfatase-like hydrolase/transferase [Thalassoroseus pseudoceratinae]